MPYPGPPIDIENIGEDLTSDIEEVSDSSDNESINDESDSGKYYTSFVF